MYERGINYGVMLLLLAFIGTTSFRVSVPAITFYAREVLGSVTGSAIAGYIYDL